MPRNPPKRAIPAGKSKGDARRTVNIPGVGKARTMELRRSDIIAMRKFEKEFRKNPEKYLRDFRPLGVAKPRKTRKRKFPNTRGWFGGIEQKVGSTTNALTEMDMRGELADTNRRGDKGVIRIQNKWGTPRKRKSA